MNAPTPGPWVDISKALRLGLDAATILEDASGGEPEASDRAAELHDIRYDLRVVYFLAKAPAMLKVVEAARKLEQTLDAFHLDLGDLDRDRRALREALAELDACDD